MAISWLRRPLRVRCRSAPLPVELVRLRCRVPKLSRLAPLRGEVGSLVAVMGYLARSDMVESRALTWKEEEPLLESFELSNGTWKPLRLDWYDLSVCLRASASENEVPR